ncbi:hypothetical protein [Pontibacter litorisediminis]|uniref:hypothetical protein n=1 Tax=Pontibacter litorisediminis TaxID=1846260 RepID=UPI0023ED59B1|nr:hypothetical protein [Pontibacter litorisediminis]
MRKILLSVVAALSLLPALQAQDVITKRTGEKVEAKVLEVSPSEIKYKRYSNQEGPTYILPKSEIVLITYEDKTSEVFELEDQAASNASASSQTVATSTNQVVYEPATKMSSLDMYAKGQADGKMFYDGYKAAGTGTLVASLISPIIGLVPAAITSASSPKEKNWDAPSNQLLQDPDYKSGYQKSARKKKAGKVWVNWGIGLGVNLVLAIIVAGQ